MSREDIIKLARKSGWSDKDINSLLFIVETAAAAEREACAKVCDDLRAQIDSSWDCCHETLQDTADAIRARGNT